MCVYIYIHSFSISFNFTCNLTKFWIGDCDIIFSKGPILDVYDDDIIFITQFLKANIIYMQPHGQPRFKNKCLLMAIQAETFSADYSIIKNL